MKIAFRLLCVVTLLAGSWAVSGADRSAAKISVRQPTPAPLRIRTAADQDSRGKGSPTTESDGKNDVVSPAGPTAAPSKNSHVDGTTSNAATMPVPAATSTAARYPSNVASPPVAPVITKYADEASGSQVRLSMSTLAPTPEMWFYEQMRADYNNPALQSRIRAEREADERRARIASRQWYGVSLARPSAHPTPFTYHYSAAWGSNTRNPFVWSATGAAPIVVRQRNAVSLSGFGW